MQRTVVMRDVRNGADSRSLRASINADGALVIAGHDLGPATSAVSGDGEHEWYYEHPAETIPDLLEVLSAPRDADILTVIAQRYTGDASDDFERRVSESALTPRLFLP